MLFSSAIALSTIFGIPSPAPLPPAGNSGTLVAQVSDPSESLKIDNVAASARWVRLEDGKSESVRADGGEIQAPSESGTWTLEEGSLRSATVLVRLPFSAKRGGRIRDYQIGTYPGETTPSGRYALPAGFIEVNPANQDLKISEHFRLRDFLTKGQSKTWPKYVVLDMRLIDKLELVLQELNAMGIRAEHMHVMSGYRTPSYNGPGGDGRATNSRHMYGDAADIWVDSDRNGDIDDLNHDGRTDLADAHVILKAVDRVEAKYPDLIGGTGVYRANSAHPEFVHIDTRGRRARW